MGDVAPSPRRPVASSFGKGEAIAVNRCACAAAFWVQPFKSHSVCAAVMVGGVALLRAAGSDVTSVVPRGSGARVVVGPQGGRGRWGRLLCNHLLSSAMFLLGVEKR